MNEVLDALRELIGAVQSASAACFDEAARSDLEKVASAAAAVTSKYRTAVSIGEHRLIFDCPKHAAEFARLSLNYSVDPDAWRAAAANATNIDSVLRHQLQTGAGLS